MRIRLDELSVNEDHRKRSLNALIAAKNAKAIDDDLDDCLCELVRFLDALPSQERHGFHVTGLEIEVPDQVANFLPSLKEA